MICACPNRGNGYYRRIVTDGLGLSTSRVVASRRTYQEKTASASIPVHFVVTRNSARMTVSVAVRSRDSLSNPLEVLNQQTTREASESDSHTTRSSGVFAIARSRVAREELPEHRRSCLTSSERVAHRGIPPRRGRPGRDGRAEGRSRSRSRSRRP